MLLVHTASGGATTNIGRARVDTIENLWSGDWDKVGISIYSLSIEVDLPIDLDIPPTKPLDDFLSAGISYDIEGGEDP